MTAFEIITIFLGTLYNYWEAMIMLSMYLAWLNKLALEQNINFSQVLQEALIAKINNVRM